MMSLIAFCCTVEDRNFALFKFVNEQNNEAESLRDQISQVSSLYLSMSMDKLVHFFYFYLSDTAVEYNEVVFKTTSSQ